LAKTLQANQTTRGDVFPAFHIALPNIRRVLSKQTSPQIPPDTIAPKPKGAGADLGGASAIFEIDREF
jgi:hypothetical protein